MDTRQSASKSTGPTCAPWPTGCSARSARRTTPSRRPGSASTGPTRRRGEPARLADDRGFPGVAQHPAHPADPARGTRSGPHMPEPILGPTRGRPIPSTSTPGRLGRRGPARRPRHPHPAERLAFVLHDIFAVPFDEIAPIVERSPEAARQLASRARRRIQGERDRPRRRHRTPARGGRRLPGAARNGDFDALLAVLDPDVVVRADQGAVAVGVDATAGRSVARRPWRAGPWCSPRWACLSQPALVNGVAGAVSTARTARQSRSALSRCAAARSSPSTSWPTPSAWPRSTSRSSTAEANTRPDRSFLPPPTVHRPPSTVHRCDVTNGAGNGSKEQNNQTQRERTHRGSTPQHVREPDHPEVRQVHQLGRTGHHGVDPARRHAGARQVAGQ